MVTIENPEYKGRKCNVCFEDAYCEIYFRNDRGHSGIVVACCEKCMQKLVANFELFKANHKES